MEFSDYVRYFNYSLALSSFHQSVCFRRTRHLHFIMRFWFAFDCSPGICNAKQCNSWMNTWGQTELSGDKHGFRFKIEHRERTKVYLHIVTSSCIPTLESTLFPFFTLFRSDLYVMLLLHFVFSFLATLFVPLHYPSSNQQSRQVSALWNSCVIASAEPTIRRLQNPAVSL